MSDEEDYDIAGSLALDTADSDPESQSESDFSDNEDIQDVISSDDEGEDDKQTKKKQKTNNKKAQPKQAFPSLELSDDEDDSNEAKDMSSYFAFNNPQAKKAKNGSFQSFGFSKFLLTNISKKGFRQPTPIQRKTIPLVMENRDVVGMARTGSGKTAAFTLPVVE